MPSFSISRMCHTFFIHVIGFILKAKKSDNLQKYLWPLLLIFIATLHAATLLNIISYELTELHSHLLSHLLCILSFDIILWITANCARWNLLFTLSTTDGNYTLYIIYLHYNTQAQMELKIKYKNMWSLFTPHWTKLFIQKWQSMKYLCNIELRKEGSRKLSC